MEHRVPKREDQGVQTGYREVHAVRFDHGATGVMSRRIATAVTCRPPFTASVNVHGGESSLLQQAARCNRTL